MRVMAIEETAQRLGLSPRSLADKRFRMRLGLPGVKLGRRMGFDENDVERVIARGRETFPLADEPEAPPPAESVAWNED